MKHFGRYLLAMLLLSPCLMLVSEGCWAVNILGLVYVVMLRMASRTRLGKDFLRLIENTNETIIKKLK